MTHTHSTGRTMCYPMLFQLYPAASYAYLRKKSAKLLTLWDVKGDKEELYREHVDPQLN